METTCNILWVDDTLTDIANWKGILEKYGIRFETTDNATDGLKLSKQSKFDKILVDLQMPNMNGVEFIRELEQRDEKTPITIVSAHLDEPKWKRELKTLDRSYDGIKLFLPIERTDKFNKIIDKIFSNTSKSYNPIDSYEDPTLIPLDKLISLSPELLEKMKEKMLNYKEGLLQEIIKSHDASWIVYCANEVIMLGNVGDEPPDEKTLDKISKDYGLLPILYFRSPIIEEIYWSMIKNSLDYYPTMTVCVSNSDEKVKVTGDFDTGSEATFLDFNSLSSVGLVKKSFFDFTNSGQHLGHNFKYLNKETIISIADETGKEVSLPMRCLFVLDWMRSPFIDINKSRKALIGRDIFKHFKLKLYLDTSKKQTSINHIDG